MNIVNKPSVSSVYRLVHRIGQATRTYLRTYELTNVSVPLHIEPLVTERAREEKQMDAQGEERTPGGYCCDLCRRMERE